MRKLIILVLLTTVMLSTGIATAQDATATPTPLPPMAFNAKAGEFMGDSDNFAGIDPTGQTITYWHQYNSATQLAIITGWLMRSTRPIPMASL